MLFPLHALKRLRDNNRWHVVGGGLSGTYLRRVDRNLTTPIANRMVRAQQTNIIFQKLKGVGKNESCLAQKGNLQKKSALQIDVGNMQKYFSADFLFIESDMYSYF